MHEVNDFSDKVKIRDTLSCSLLNAAVKIDGEYTFGTGRYTSGSQCIAESVVLYLIA